ncbi:hypothetical protein GCM10012275_57570 [Longimycelium tulufanense]|uniref:Uncharacterized protein n=1 Tax=Longimycelium tulufanense TaxID=907463 RepID=A0A8J3FXG3_9PSEU|nr:hypothetical protein [Longimycelium tulufanense]GGM79450.1 hypothetical protein GCM10012275_57570 [Longimycelium tulufanense]
MAVPDTCTELSVEQRQALYVERRREDLARAVRAADSLTGVLALLGGRPVELELGGRRERIRLTVEQRRLLDAAPDEWAQYRWGVLRDAARHPVAYVEALVLLHRLPYETATQLRDSDIPLGRALRRWGVRRHVQGQLHPISEVDLAGAELDMGITAVLDLADGRSVAVVRERLYKSFVDAYVQAS